MENERERERQKRQTGTERHASKDLFRSPSEERRIGSEGERHGAGHTHEKAKDGLT